MKFRSFWVPGALFLGACTSPTPATPPPAPRGLRVPLPDGWTAREIAPQVLVAGPKGQGVLRVERGGAPLPTIDAFAQTLEAEGTEVLTRVTRESFRAVKYRVHADGGGETNAFLALKETQGQVFLCASEPGALEGQQDAALAACEKLEFSAAPH